MTAPAERDLAGKSLLIFDDALHTVDGHWYSHDLAVAKMHVDRGAKVTILSHKSFPSPEAFKRLGVEVLPLVEKSLWAADFLGEGLREEIRMTAWQVRSYIRLLRRHLRSNRYDCVFAPNAMVFDALAWCALRRVYRVKDVPRLVLLFRFGIGDYRADGPPKFARKLKLLRWALRCHTAQIKQGATELLTDSTLLMRDYEVVTGLSLKVAPSPIEMPVLRDSAADRLPVFGTLGYARMEKGIDVLQSAIRSLIESRRAVGMRFLLQWNRKVVGVDGAILPRDSVLAKSGKVEFIDHSLSTEDYARALAQIDCMVLPYRRTAYRSQISGLAVEAACAGIPIIYTENTWIADFVEAQGVGIAIPDGDAGKLAEAIAEIAKNWAEYGEQALRRAEVARRLNSHGHFLNMLWGSQVDGGVQLSMAQ